MKRILNIFCALALALILTAAVLVFRSLPTDTRPYVEEKYAGWSGVLRAWVCCRWEAGGSLTRWLNDCAAAFERAHDGVYIEFTQVSEAAMAGFATSGIRPPELLLHSPGVLSSGEGLSSLDCAELLREELRGDARALPVAMGGYVWAYNPSLCEAPPAAPGASLSMLPDDDARKFSAALVALMCGGNGASPTPEPPGLDLGLPAMAEGAELEVSQDAFERFAAGELAALPVTQKEIARLIRLRDAGRGPDWALAAGGNLAYTDQLLYISIVDPAEDEEARERAALAAEFARQLLSEEAQAALSDAGALSSCGRTIYGAGSAYAPLDAALHSGELLAPRPFSECSAPELAAIVREVWSGELSAESAAERLRRNLSPPPLETNALYNRKKFRQIQACIVKFLH